MKKKQLFLHSDRGNSFQDKLIEPIGNHTNMNKLITPFDFNGIKGFTYERGHEYYLSVERTILANPPMDASDRTYSLLRILSDRLVTEPEAPVDKEINSEKDIEYYDMCPFNKYAIYKNFIVSENGEISYADGSLTPSYDSARIWLENILDKADPNWVKFQRVSYMAIYSFVLSPLTKEIRLVRNESYGPMFKDGTSEIRVYCKETITHSHDEESIFKSDFG